MKEPSSAVVHFYRAIVMHADVWRERLDATTNWAVVTTIGVISFAFSRPDTPHFVLLFLIAASWLFLIMETRRYQVYDLWRRRIRSINQFIIAPRISSKNAPPQEEIDRGLTALALDLGRAVPHLRFVDALGYRIRRNYGFIFLFTVGSWILKLILHPGEPTSFSEVVSHAELAAIPGSVVVSIVAILSLIVLFLALRAPSEQMISWRRLPSPLSRMRTGSAFAEKLLEEESKESFVRPGPSAPRPLEEFFPPDEVETTDVGDDSTASGDSAALADEPGDAGGDETQKKDPPSDDESSDDEPSSER